MNAQSELELPAFKTVLAGTNRVCLKTEQNIADFDAAEFSTEPTPPTIDHDFEISTEPVSTEWWCKRMDGRLPIGGTATRFLSPDFEDCRLSIRLLNRCFRGSWRFRLPTQEEFLAAASDGEWKSECIDHEWIDGGLDGKVRFINASSPEPTVDRHEPDWHLPPPCGFHLVRVRDDSMNPEPAPEPEERQQPRSVEDGGNPTDTEPEKYWSYGQGYPSRRIALEPMGQNPRLWFTKELVSQRLWDDLADNDLKKVVQACFGDSWNPFDKPYDNHLATRVSWEDCIAFLDVLNSKLHQGIWYPVWPTTPVPAGRFRLLLASEWEALQNSGVIRANQAIAEWCLDGPDADYPDDAVREDLWDDGFARYVCGGTVKAPGAGVPAAFPKEARSDGIGFRLVWDETNYKLTRRPRHGRRSGIPVGEEPLVGYLDDLFQDAFAEVDSRFDTTLAKQAVLDQVKVLEVRGPSPVFPSDDGFREIWKRTLERARELSSQEHGPLFDSAILEKAESEAMRDMPREKRGEWNRRIRDGAERLFDKALGLYSADDRTIRLYTDMIADTAEGLSILPEDLEDVTFLHEFSHWTHHAIVSDFPKRRFSDASAELLECIAQLLPFKALERASATLRSERPKRLKNAFLLLNFEQSSKYARWKEFEKRSPAEIVRALLALRTDGTQAPDVDRFRNSLPEKSALKTCS